MIVTVPSGEFAQEFQELVQEEVNVKTMKIQKGDYAVELDLTLTPELVREGMVREIIRRVNDLRKEQGLTIADRIDLYVSGPEQVLLAVKEHQNVLLQGTLSGSVRTEGELPSQLVTFKTQECEITVGF
jgi:isoleucyl-tRNA synthetase